MFDHMLEEKEVQDEFEKYELDAKEHGAFIKELIMGEPDKKAPPVSTLLELLFTSWLWG